MPARADTEEPGLGAEYGGGAAAPKAMPGGGGGGFFDAREVPERLKVADEADGLRFIDPEDDAPGESDPPPRAWAINFAMVMESAAKH